MHISVVELVGKNALTPEDGKAVYSILQPEIAAGRTVALDFSGVSVFASPFFNWGIGRLIADFPPELLNRMLKFSNIAPAGDRALRRSIDNAKEYYAEPEQKRNLIDEAVHHGAVTI